MGLRSDSDDANDDAFLWCILHNNKCSNGLYSTLKGDYGKTTLSSLHWREILAGAPNIGIFGNKVRPQHQEVCSLPYV